MKLRTIRYSGLPVAPENLAAYDAEFKAAYDKIQADHAPDMLVVHQKLKELDAELTAKWTSIELSQLPKSKKGWKKFLEQYDAPIMVARSSEDVDEVVLVIMDQPLA